MTTQHFSLSTIVQAVRSETIFLRCKAENAENARRGQKAEMWSFWKIPVIALIGDWSGLNINYCWNVLLRLVSLDERQHQKCFSSKMPSHRIVFISFLAVLNWRCPNTELTKNFAMQGRRTNRVVSTNG